MQWARSLKDWNKLHRECRYHLADRVLALEAESADTKLKLRRLLNAIEIGTRSTIIAKRITELEFHLIDIEAQITELAHDPKPLPTAAQLKSRLECRTRHLLHRLAIPKQRSSAAVEVAAMIVRVDMRCGAPGRRSTLEILPDLLHLARSVRDPRS